jgi:hypothetical protein
MATKKEKTTHFFPLLIFVVVSSAIRDPGAGKKSRIRDVYPGSATLVEIDGPSGWNLNERLRV